MKRVLIITYYWPPMGGSGVQRWLKFAKYLPTFGWEPIVYTPENPSFQLHDDSLLSDVRDEQIVWKHPIWEPHHLFYRAKGKKNLAQVNQGDILDKKNQSLFEKLGLWVRGNLLIPDPRRFWIGPSVKYLMRRLADERIDAIVTTGPPHSLHHIGRLLHQRTGIPWLADFRDPWTRWVFLRSFHVSARAMRLHRRQEKQVLQSAQAVTTVSQALREDFEELGGRPVHALTNGYDEADFATAPQPTSPQFLISYIGTIDYLRDPRTFLQALRALCRERADFAEYVRIRFVGYLSGVILKDIENDAVLADKLTIAHYVPHEEVLRLLQDAYVHLLLLSSGPETRGILTGKFFEYLASGKRILALGSVGSEIDQILQTTRAGVLHDPQDAEGIKATLLRYFEDYKNNASLNTIGVEQYSRRNLTKSLSKILDSITEA
jgi:glycosyltransferase involved in cell wall biosynthesis